MFWTNWNEQSPSIMRATLTGSNVLVIIGNDIRTPNGLAIDHRAEKLYFSDATLDKIERCEYDGTRRYVSKQHSEMHFSCTYGCIMEFLVLLLVLCKTRQGIVSVALLFFFLCRWC